MPRDVARAGLYRGSINLWVEDRLSREYLSTLWNDPDVAFFVGGGNEGVRAIVRDAEDAGFTNVFAVTDRDFRPTNRASWDDPAKTFHTFVLPVHEIENYLLDSRALQASRFSNLGLTEAEIEEHMGTAARRLCWWAACRDVVAELKCRFREPFVSDPPCSLDRHDAAKEHICGSEWFKKLESETAKTRESDIDRLLNEGFETAQGRLEDRSWRIEFAGKEIFHDIGSRICDRQKIRGYRPTPVEFDIDLAKDIAAWQLASDAVPPDLVHLLTALKARIARMPPADAG
jgi:hypothetical protein